MSKPIFPSDFERTTPEEREHFLELIDEIPTNILRQVVLERDQKNRQRDLLRAAVSDVHSSTAIMVETYFDAVSRIDDNYSDNADHYSQLFSKAVNEILTAYWETQEREERRDLEAEKRLLERKKTQE